jgi:hypothetical protein
LAARFQHKAVSQNAEKKIREYLHSEPLLVISDDPGSVVNDTDVFNYVNREVSEAGVTYIDYKKALKLVKDVQLEVAEETSETFLTDNL